jgi:RNA polymerase sigma factor (TIGR02999 family)
MTDTGQDAEGRHSLDGLMQEAYQELRAITRRHLRREGGYHTLQTTALVHEAFIRLRGRRLPFKGKAHLLAAATTEIRRILVDHARARRTRKRSVPEMRVDLGGGASAADAATVDLLAVDEALCALTRKHVRIGKVAELRLLADMSVEDISKALGVSPRTVRDDWRFARVWLGRRLRGPASFHS